LSIVPSLNHLSNCKTLAEIPNRQQNPVGLHILELSDELASNFICECFIPKIEFDFSAEISVI